MSKVDYSELEPISINDAAHFLQLDGKSILVEGSLEDLSVNSRMTGSGKTAQSLELVVKLNQERIYPSTYVAARTPLHVGPSNKSLINWDTSVPMDLYLHLERLKSAHMTPQVKVGGEIDLGISMAEDINLLKMQYVRVEDPDGAIDYHIKPVK